MLCHALCWSFGYVPSCTVVLGWLCAAPCVHDHTHFKYPHSWNAWGRGEVGSVVKACLAFGPNNGILKKCLS